MSLIAHPVTGEVIDRDDADGLAAAYAAAEAHIGERYRAIRAELRPVYDARDKVLERLAEIRGPAVLPPRRAQTDKQALVERCPRCTDRIPEPSTPSMPVDVG